jgi:hypothetical protein
MKRPNIYELILEGIRKYKGLDDRNLQDYLKNLQPEVRKLRSAFRTSLISVNWSSSATQIAYLLAYYPKYHEMTYQILKQVQQEVFTDGKFRNCDSLKLCIFGAGPCPEMTGLSHFLSEFSSNICNLHAVAFDIHDWTVARAIVVDFIMPELWEKRLEFESYTIDLCAENCFVLHKTLIQDADICIFQNCFNELSNAPEFEKNCEYLIKVMKSTSYLIIGDLCYEQNFKIKDAVITISEALNSRFRFFHEEIVQILVDRTSNPIEHKVPFAIPEILTQNLLIAGKDDLIPSTMVRFITLIAEKQYSIPAPSRISALEVGLKEIKLALQNLETKTTELQDSQSIPDDQPQAGLDDGTQMLWQHLNQKIDNLEKIIQTLLRNEKKNLDCQLKMMRLALIFSSMISLIALVLALTLKR